MKTFKELVAQEYWNWLPSEDFARSNDPRQIEGFIRDYLVDEGDWVKVEREPHPIGERVRIWWGDQVGRKTCRAVVIPNNPGKLLEEERDLLTKWDDLRDVAIYYIGGGLLEHWYEDRGEYWEEDQLERQVTQTFSAAEFELMVWEADREMAVARLRNRLMDNSN
jgi:hypothetical protein